jgi:prepilin-type N-terminal cleavage/methylation domain-containing protein
MSSAVLRLLLQKTPHSKGFSLPEVLVGIMILTIFIAVAMQAMVSAVAMQVGTDKTTQSDDWIQADLESVRFLASRLPNEPSRWCGGTPGYAQLLQRELGNTTNQQTFQQTFTADGVSYSLNRSFSAGVDPHVLVLQYQVTPATEVKPASEVKPLASKRFEVMPDAALNCP